MNNKTLVIVDNEKIFEENGLFFCDNIDSKSIPEGLSSFKKTYLIARKSKIKRAQKINLTEINASINILTFIRSIFKTFSIKNVNYLLISINPYTFFSFITLFLFKKKVFVYLRSSGHEEYKSKYGIFGTLVYHIMYFLVTSKADLIVCQKRLTKKISRNN